MTDSPPAGVATVAQRLARRAADTPDAKAFLWLPDGENVADELSFADLHHWAQRLAAHLGEFTTPGERILIMTAPGLDYIASFFGSLYAGLVPVPAYPPSPFMLDRDLERLGRVVEDAEASVALTAKEWLELAEGAGLTEHGKAVRWVCTDDLPVADGPLPEPPEQAASDLAFLQYTSGSTNDPKGVMVTHGNLVANLDLIQRVYGMQEGEVAVTWLPPYHDMGLIGLVLGAISFGLECVVMPPDAFLRKPLRWLKAISDYGATTTAAPNFAFELVVRRTKPEDREGLDLSHWRIAINGAEPVSIEAMDRFVGAFGPHGFRQESMWPAYGLAESTLFVTSGRLGKEAAIFDVDVAALAEGKIVPAPAGAGSRSLVACGPPQPEISITVIRPETSEPVPDGVVGEIVLTGQSIAGGYWKNPAESEAAFTLDPSGNQLRTGDLGALVDGKIVVTGRLKDLIIVRGRNHYPQDIETTVAGASVQFRQGCGCVFSVSGPGGEVVAVVQEIKDPEHADPQELVDLLAHAVTAGHNVSVDAVALIAPRTIPKTSSGKVRRRATRDAFVTDDLASVVHAWRSPRWPTA